MNAATTKLGILGAILLATVALPASTALARDRDDRGDRGDRGRIERRDNDRSQRPDFNRDRSDRDHRDGGVRVQVRIAAPAPVRTVPGHYETRTETVLVEPAHYETRTEQILLQDGHWEERTISGRTEVLRDSRGNLHVVKVEPDRVERVWCPPVYQTRTVQVLVPARYEIRTVQVYVPGTVVTTRPSPVQAGIGIGLNILGQILR